MPAGISKFHEKPSGDDLAKLKAVSKNATEQDPFEVSMGIYVFKRDVLVRQPVRCWLLLLAGAISASLSCASEAGAAADSLFWLANLDTCMQSWYSKVYSNSLGQGQDN